MNTKYMQGRWLTIVLLSIALLFISSAVYAQVLCTHGHSGTIEYPDRLETLERVHIGWGLDFDQKPGGSNWIHFAPPTIYGQNIRYIALQFLTGSVDSFIDSVHIYNLGTKVAEFDDLGWSGDELQAQTLDLGSSMPFLALGISVQVKAGVESMSHRILFTGVCIYE